MRDPRPESPFPNISSSPFKLIFVCLYLLDNKGDDAGDRLADDVFISNGYMGAAHMPPKGSVGLKPLTGIQHVTCHD
jgi:hypothetical protein